MRSCAWIGNSSPCIMCVSILFTILSMSDCLGMCFLMIDNGVPTGTSGWDFCVYSISGGLMVLTACISNLDVSLTFFVRLSELVLIVMD